MMFAPNRRELFAAAGKATAASAFIVSPAIAKAHAGLAEWDTAVSRYESATAAVDAFSRDWHDPAERAYFAGKRDYPKFMMPVAADAHGPARSVEWNAGTIMKFGGADHADNPSELAVYAASQMPVIRMIDDHNERLRAKLNVDALEAEYERLLDLACDARDDLFAMPAPDWAALAYKLRLLSENNHLALEEGDDDPLPMITADAQRLARGALS